ncbi:MAG: hypothetical protein JWP89_4283 [Schlesneria sp.]|nr:hypothetical protein [Schlesneria sp.]
MSVVEPKTKLVLPEALQTQLHEFRHRVWTIKSIEAACGAVFGVFISYLAVFSLDRMVDTPGPVRMGIFLLAVGGCAFVPVYLHRWIWCHRRFEQLARLVSRKLPLIGDQLLGIIELVRSESEQQRSRALVEAAVAQVAVETGKRDLQAAIPNPRHRFWAWMAVVPAAVAILMLCLFPAAATNAWARFAAPWQSVPRYTFTAVEQLPQRLVVAHGEPVTVSVKLLEKTQSKPPRGTAWLGSQLPITAELRDGRYEFSLPAQIDSGWFSLKIGDAQQRVRIEPMMRPEISSVVAEVQLPDYLLRPQVIHKDVRGGTVSIVNGSSATFKVTANRELSSALIDNQSASIAGATISSETSKIQASRKMIFQWQDEFGLGGLEPFTVNITGRDDEAPSLSCEDLPRQKIVIDSETLSFKIRAQDDFGVKVVGIEWQGMDKSAVSKPAKGERILGAGASDKELLELAGTFCAKTLDIEPQPLSVRLFVEDYLPGRSRTYSPAYTLYVLSADQHAIWLTEQLSKWHRQSLEVRDREMQLHHTNQQLRMLTPEELDQPENRRRIDTQSTAERANGRRLTGLVTGGEELVRQAMRNPEFGVGHLEKWAEMLQILKDISGNRMPNVADLLKQSSQAPVVASNSPSKPSPSAGQIQTSPPGGSKPSESKPKPPVPTVVDAESSQQPAKKNKDEPEEPSKSNSKSRLTLPVTTVTGGSGRKSPPAPANEKLDEAVAAQQDLLAEFDKIADELNKVLANLEGSTLVKRLKAASRHQYVIAGKINDQIGGTFGLRGKAGGAAKPILEELSKQESKCSLDLSNIMDDMQAYFERRRFQRFKTVLDEMREQDAVGSLRQLGDDVRGQTGLSMAQAEFWSDTFDRWADDLVDPASCGKCPGCKSKSSLPPSIVLEAMHILEAEVHLREETRVAEQAREALSKNDYQQRAKKLSETQDGLSERVSKLTDRIIELPDGESEFGKEIALLKQVERVMLEAAEILDRPDTGKLAIAAETEAIELLLQSKRINPRGGGGGGSSPGGGGGGTTNDSALALIGSGVNEKEVREDRGVSQSTGESGAAFPEEFRAGLDEYFNRLERDGTK